MLRCCVPLPVLPSPRCADRRIHVFERPPSSPARQQMAYRWVAFAAPVPTLCMSSGFPQATIDMIGSLPSSPKGPRVPPSETTKSLVFRLRLLGAGLCCSHWARAAVRIQAGPLLILACIGMFAPTPGIAQYVEDRQPAPAVDPAKEAPNLCPVRWGRRPRRAGAPGAVTYVSEWGPCKPKQETSAPLPTVPSSPTVANRKP